MVEIDLIPKGDWLMRFERGEPDSRAKAGEWQQRTLADDARDRLKDVPDVVAAVGEYGERTFRQLFDEAVALARGLLELGVRPGETVSFQLPNWLEAISINLACALGGFVINRASYSGLGISILGAGCMDFCFISIAWINCNLSF